MKCWEIDTVASIPNFLRAIVQFLPAAKILSFEIQGECDEARAFYVKHKSLVKLRPSRDTIAPRTKLFYCVASHLMVQDLEVLLQGRKNRDVFWHIKGYEESKMLFSIHDADSACSAVLSPLVDVEIIRLIAGELGCEPASIKCCIDWDEDFAVKKK